MEYKSSSMQLKHTKRLCLKTDHLQLLRMQWSRDGSWPAARPSCPCGIVGPTNQRSGQNENYENSAKLPDWLLGDGTRGNDADGLTLDVRHLLFKK